MTTEAVHEAITDIVNTAANLGNAQAHEMALEDGRHLVKQEAIKRLMESGAATSVTAAEKLVDTDPEYAAHREQQRAAVANTIYRRGLYEAEKLRARFMVEMWTLEAGTLVPGTVELTNDAR
jgi:hypothetical protein